MTSTRYKKRMNGKVIREVLFGHFVLNLRATKRVIYRPTMCNGNYRYLKMQSKYENTALQNKGK